MAALIILLLLATVLALAGLSQSTPLLPRIDSQTSSCADQHRSHPLICELQDAKLRIARLETILEESVQSLNARILHIQEREKLIVGMGVKIQQLQSDLLSIKDNSSRADGRVDALEKEVQLLWAASRKNNFDIHILESKVQDAEERLEELSSQVEKMASIVTERWIQIRQLEQALQITQTRTLKAQELAGSKRCIFLKFINKLYRNYLQNLSEMLDPYLPGKEFAISSYMSEALHRIKVILSAAKTYHHQLQGYIKQEMERNEFTAALANEELVFFVASAIITFPIMSAWMLLSSQFA
ncbi:uncharacterized protein LOC131144157 [Malania oleifera]|uniref:uncharacterized protein LOC131144157 n=1 Tax=Malania oleifera TaxID=397392 RepID=UPI0025AEC5A0|nr:uncharacterized protein LOC131144157 [Malania oleifera]